MRRALGACAWLLPIVAGAATTPDQLVLCYSSELRLMVTLEKGVRNQKCEAPEGPFRLLVPDPFFGPTLKPRCNKAPVPIEAALAPKPVPSPPLEEMDAAIQRGIAFLLTVQNENGSWGSPHRTKDLNIYAPVPGSHHAFRAAVTSLCLCALIEAGAGADGVQAAIERGEVWMFDHLPQLRRATPEAIYNTWGHAYAIQALVRMYERQPEDPVRQKAIAQLIRDQMGMLGRFESVDGGWGYYDMRAGAKRPTSSSLSFVNGTVLVALKEARDIGIEPDAQVVQRAIAATLRQQKSDFSYLYGEYLKYWPMRAINRPGGSLGRSQVCNLALRIWDDKNVNDAAIRTWLNRLCARDGWLSIGRKRPVPHESWFQVAGYFYYYGHYYAARCIALLPEEERPFYQDQLAHLIAPLQELDGSWWDFPFYNYHQQYGTAFAVMTLLRCRRPAIVTRSETPVEPTAPARPAAAQNKCQLPEGLHFLRNGLSAVPPEGKR